MPGNTFGSAFRITTYGESHGAAVGVVIDGCPSGLSLDESDVQRELDKRKPGKSSVTTGRVEGDKASILSGVLDGKTTGAPISIMVHNKSFDSSPYIELKNKPRPSHADFTYAMKYKNYDWRGGGRASGRETIGRVAAGAVAKKLLAALGIEILGHAREVHGIAAEEVSIDEIRKNIEKNPIRCADLKAAERMQEEILKARGEGDSLGGIAEVIALNVPVGLGEPVFDKLSADIAKAVMSIGSVKGVEIGAGFSVAKKKGSENNDQFVIEGGKIKTITNNSGGILAGISNGMPIVVRAAVKPTSSIAKEQRTVDLEKMEETTIAIKGKHDPCIVPRIIPVCEAMLALVLADHAIRAGLIAPKL